MKSFDGRIRGDARNLPIADESVQCVVTSPPYFGLRDYGHAGQIGLESTPDEFVVSILGVFKEVWRVLKPDGTLWLNLGDSYAGSWGAQGRGEMSDRSIVSARQIAAHPHKTTMTGSVKGLGGLKPKDMMGMPWRVAFALQAAGWYLRSDIIWSKPNPMPESIKDRPTKSHEYLFLLSKSEQYFYDAEAASEPTTGNSHSRGSGVNPKAAKFPSGWDTGGGAHTKLDGRYRPKQNESFSAAVAELVSRRNIRSVWTIPTSPYPEAHYATFPPELAERCILAGTRPGDFVLDPFAGSGTVAMVAEKHGRRGVSVDLGYQDLQLKRLQNLQPLLQEQI